MVRFEIGNTEGLESAAKNVESAGVKLALKVRVPCTDGFHVQDAVKLGEVPEVATFRHPGMRLPLMKNRTKPGALTLTEIVEEFPFLTKPEIDGAPKVVADAKPATPL